MSLTSSAEMPLQNPCHSSDVSNPHHSVTVAYRAFVPTTSTHNQLGATARGRIKEGTKMTSIEHNR